MQRPTHAISIRQPYIELILRRLKKAEYRSRPTSIRGRVYLYASLSPADDSRCWRQARKKPDELPTGAILGTVEIIDCQWDARWNRYAYILRAPKRLKRKLHAKNQPNPCFWCPKF